MLSGIYAIYITGLELRFFTSVFFFFWNIDHTHKAKMINDALKYANQQKVRH